MEEGEQGLNNEEKLAGFIFMCNKMTKAECYRFRVFGLPSSRKEVVEKINPGTFLFLFDTDVKLLYGIYRATSSGKLRIEPLAFGGKFPAQVQFSIYKDCLPLRENHFRHAIQDNYQRGSNKFNPELDIRQVRSLLELFRPLPVLSTAPTHPVLRTIYPPLRSPHPPMNNVFGQISRPSFSKDVYFPRMSPNHVPWQLNYKHVYELDQPTRHSYPVHTMMPNSAAAQSVLSQPQRSQLHPSASSHTLEGSSYYQPPSDPQYSQYPNILNLQPEFHAAPMNMGGSYAQSLQDPHAYHNIQHPQPEFHSSMKSMGSSSHVQALQNPGHAHQNIVNVDSSHVQSWHDPHNGQHYQSILTAHPDSYSSMLTTGSSYVQPLPYTQHTHQNTPSLQPNLSSSLANVDHGNIMMQSHVSSSVYYPYVPQEVVSASYQGYGATQGAMYEDQQIGIGNEYHQSSMPAEHVLTEPNVQM